MIIVTLLLSAGFAFLTFAVAESSTGGQEGFSPDNPEIQAATRIGELFGEGSTQTVMQVVVTSDRGDVLSAEGLQAANQVIADLQSSEYSDAISGSARQPGIVTYMAPVQQAAAEQGIDAILLSLIGAVLVLPSMLVLWEAWHRRRGDWGTETPTTSAV